MFLVLSHASFWASYLIIVNLTVSYDHLAIWQLFDIQWCFDAEDALSTEIAKLQLPTMYYCFLMDCSKQKQWLLLPVLLHFVLTFNHIRPILCEDYLLSTVWECGHWVALCFPMRRRSMVFGIQFNLFSGPLYGHLHDFFYWMTVFFITELLELLTDNFTHLWCTYESPYRRDTR